jgi:ATP-dependent DNA helicase RecQ
MINEPLKILKQYFGYDKFRPLQESIIKNVLGKKDSLVLMPTGGGKSVCYQVPALCLPGTCIVISPLIALMKDQVEALKVNGVEAGFINSSQPVQDQQLMEKKALNGELKLLYVSPEKLTSGSFIGFLSKINVNLFAIDEAHCISAWGHDFRPEYTQLKVIKETFPGIPLIALTATADKTTKKDILKQLKINEAGVFRSSFDRPNLHLKVLPGQDKLKIIFEFLRRHKGEPGIIYCLSRKSTESLYSKLNSKGIKAEFYHAGMESNERSDVQEKFLRDDVQVICATIAFGMGIDKSNVRWVIHYNLPKNIESYYQEIGRAGRDGLRSETILFYSFSDIIKLRNFINNGSERMREIQYAKLERIQQYAEAEICRRKILLSYFGELFEHDCGNCDVCNNPGDLIDGTLIAQKALSAIARMNEKTTATILVDVLRGSMNQNILSAGFDKIKTFGAGKDIKGFEWKAYIQQMINMGLIEIAYDEKFSLKLTDMSRDVLYNGKQVKLVRPVFKDFSAKPEPEKPLEEKELFDEDLFKGLKALRKQIADSNGLPPYIIFSDKTLKEMSVLKPVDREDMLSVQGIGNRKYELYGEYFIREIKKHKSKAADIF